MSCKEIRKIYRKRLISDIFISKMKIQPTRCEEINKNRNETELK